MHFKSIFFISFLSFLAGTLFSQDSPNLWISYKWYGLGSGLGVERNILTVSGNKLVGNYEVKYHKNELSDISDKDYIREDSVFRIERVEVILKKSSIDSIISLVSPGVDTIYSGNPCVKSGEMREFAINANGNHKVYRMVNSFDSIPEKILKILIPYFPSGAVNKFIPYKLWEHAVKCNNYLFSKWKKLSGKERFFKRLFRRDSSKYLPLGSFGWHESYNTKTGDYNFRSSFMVLNTTKEGADRYLKDLDSPLLKKYLPNVEFYSGKKTIHYELGGASYFTVFSLDRGLSDFVFNGDSTACQLSEKLCDEIRGIRFKSKEGKEEFYQALLEILAPDLWFFSQHPGPLKKKEHYWENEKLIIKNGYKMPKSIDWIIIQVEFEGFWTKSINFDFEPEE